MLTKPCLNCGRPIPTFISWKKYGVIDGVNKYPVLCSSCREENVTHPDYYLHKDNPNMLTKPCIICHTPVRTTPSELKKGYPLFCPECKEKHIGRPRYYPHKDNPDYVIDLLL